MGKGIAWVPVAIGIIFLAEILIFSLAFSKVSIFSRETLDANVIFEGDELETYARSISDSVQLSTAQALYFFFLTHEGEVWQNYGTKSVPDPVPELQDSIRIYMGKFLDAHKNFPAANKPYPINFGELGNPTVSIKDGTAKDAYISVFFPQMELSKSSLGLASFKRKFTPEATLITVFGEMMSAIRQMIGDDLIGKYAVFAIGNCNLGGKGCASDAQVCKLSSYIDDYTFGNREKIGQTQTKGTKEYGEKPDVERCSKSKPSEATCEVGEPSAEQVYIYSHGKKYSEGREIMKSLASQYMACLALELDKKSEDYTVAFDEVKTDASITDSCGTKKIGLCNCRVKDECLIAGEPATLWECKTLYVKTCEYSHFDEAQVKARYQEDGFVYAWGDKIADSIKIIFKAISGNMK